MPRISVSFAASAHEISEKVLLAVVTSDDHKRFDRLAFFDAPRPTISADFFRIEPRADD
jgi:hypothetical protein